jgi:hypothetical protein
MAVLSIGHDYSREEVHARPPGGRRRRRAESGARLLEGREQGHESGICEGQHLSGQRMLDSSIRTTNSNSG